MTHENKPTQVDLFIPCFVDQVWPNAGMAMVKVLEKLGCEVFYNPEQTCCGQPAFNAGFFAEAKDVACKFLDDFALESRYVVAPSASCVGMVVNSYERFFKNDPLAERYEDLKSRTFEFTDFVVNVLGIETIEGAKFDGIATYHDSCSALRECGIKREPRVLLSGVEGLTLKEMEMTEDCCGFGGTFSVKFEPISTGMAAQKTENAMATEAQFLISTDTSCLMHLESYIRKQKYPLKPLHIAEVLASGW